MKKISKIEAWEKFLKIAEEDWRQFSEPGETLYVKDNLHHDGFWMFFKNPEIKIPAEHALSFNVSIVIREDGKTFNTPNFYPDIDKCRKALEVISIQQKLDKIEFQP